MTQYAHTTDHTPRQLPKTWLDPNTNQLIMGLPALEPSALADLGWYPVRYEPIEPGATGRGDLYFDEAAQAFIVPSLPGDPDAALQQWRNSAQITALQAMLAIDSLGYTQHYETWANHPDRTFAEKAFINKAQHWTRNDALFNAAADALGFAETDKDQFFQLGETL